MKKWKRILAVAVMLALVFCAGRGSAVLVKSWQNGGLLGVNAVASTTENWGLGFGESGTQPTGNATPEELRKYNTYFIGNGDDKVIYLTFDCGYENGNTEKILEALKKHDVKATFFVVGHFLETSPDLVRKMVEEGHTVGNHTYHHPDMSEIADVSSFQKEVEDVKLLYEEITDKEMVKFYRPPQGKYSESNLKMAKELGYYTFFCICYGSYLRTHHKDISSESYDNRADKNKHRYYLSFSRPFQIPSRRHKHVLQT